MSGDDQEPGLGEFRAPSFEPHTPAAVKAAGKRLMAYAKAHNIAPETGIVDMLLVGEADEVEGLARDQRLMQWFVSTLGD